ncbi:MAG: ABC transporter permease [Corynebacterium sp.]|uniref:ABC transporter permease n=1 Tax=Corynebacterium sp. TaxID=1720 RepID=UPI0026DA8106|nr:ABC transporter permease [Corynebacterium sp.]MDO4760789.1 ABC transporter permease [Corynebacterium sp.]
MSIVESLRLALSNVAGNKMRSLLTLLGVVIGIASVIAILTLGQALRSSTTSSLSNFGASDFSVMIQPIPTKEMLDEIGGEQFYYYFGDLEDPDMEISEDMVEELRSYLGTDLQGIAIGDTGSVSGGYTIGDEEVSGTLNFINADFQDMRGIKIEHGRALNEDDIFGNRPVAVVSKPLAEKLFDGQAARAVGQEMTFDTGEAELSVTIVGVQKESQGGLLGSFGPPPANAYVPYGNQAHFKDEVGHWQTIAVRKTPEADGAEFQKKLEEYFAPYYQDSTEYRVKIRDNSTDLDTFNKVLSTISSVIAAIGGISLLVGGIGVMNIMLITVTERTREIGIRKALGATRRDIRRQFVIEAMVVCMIGGIIGMILGSVVGMVGATFMGGVVLPPLWGVLVSLLFCLAIGLFFGWYPANRAAKLDPIEALRHE